jgi:hypothetical protein
MSVREIVSVRKFFPFSGKKGVLTPEATNILKNGLGSLNVPDDAELKLEKVDGGFELVVTYEKPDVEGAA